MSTPAPHPAPASASGGAGPLQVSIVTPEGLAFEGAAASVVVPAHDGEVAFYPLHAAYVGALGCGELRVEAIEGGRRRWFLEGGVAEVAQNAVTVLAERVLPVEKIDVARTRAELDKAVASRATDEAQDAQRERVIRSAQVRLRLAGAASTSPAPDAH